MWGLIFLALAAGIVIGVVFQSLNYGGGGVGVPAPQKAHHHHGCNHHHGSGFCDLDCFVF